MLRVPTLDIENGVCRAWWFDPLVATASFAFWIHCYWYQERQRGLSTDNSFMQTVGLDWGPLFNSVGSYWIGVYLFKCVVPPPATILPDGIPGDAEDFFYLIAEVASGIVLYDFCIFFLHWAMHECPILKSWHARHHERRETLEARDTLRHSLLDGSLQVVTNIIVQRHTPWGAVKSRLARALHNLLVTWMLVESHTSSPVPYVWRQWLMGVRDHREHHLGTGSAGTRGGKSGTYGKYHRHQQFFGYLDDARAWYSISHEH